MNSQYLLSVGYIPTNVCDEIIKSIENEGNKTSAGLIGEGLIPSINRNCDVCFTNIGWIKSLIDGIIKQVNEMQNGFDVELDESLSKESGIQYTIYGEDGKYDWHRDDDVDFNLNRKLSFILQLSDDKEYDGGNLEFQIRTDSADERICIEEFRTKGSVVVFPSNTLHRVTPVKNGVRKTLVYWASGPRWR